MIMRYVEMIIRFIIFFINNEEVTQSISCHQAINEPRMSILPGGGMKFNTRVPVSISNADKPKKIAVTDDGEVFRDEDTGEVVDMVNIRTGGGRQAFHHVSVGLVWKVANTKRRDAKMTILAGSCNPYGTNVEFLVVECSKNLGKQEVLEMLEIEEVKLWVFMLDDALLRSKDNTTRKLIHDLAKVMENCLAEFYGPATLNLNLHPNVLNVAREVAENTSIITREVVNKLFSTYSARTMRIISRVDCDTEMVLVVCTMMAWKDRVLGICNWPQIVMVDNYHCAWPEMQIYRK